MLSHQIIIHFTQTLYSCSHPRMNSTIFFLPSHPPALSTENTSLLREASVPYCTQIEGGMCSKLPFAKISFPLAAARRLLSGKTKRGSCWSSKKEYFFSKQKGKAIYIRRMAGEG